MLIFSLLYFLLFLLLYLLLFLLFPLLFLLLQKSRIKSRNRRVRTKDLSNELALKWNERNNTFRFSLFPSSVDLSSSIKTATPTFAYTIPYFSHRNRNPFAPKTRKIKTFSQIKSERNKFFYQNLMFI